MIWKIISGFVISLTGIVLLVYILLNEVNMDYRDNEPQPYYGYFDGITGSLILIIIGIYILLKVFNLI